MDTSRFHDAVVAAAEAADAPGATAALWMDGVLHETAVGVCDSDGRAATTATLFRIGSIMKPVTAMLIAQAAHEGRLDLGDMLIAHAPELRSLGGPWRGLTLRHVLTHQSGLDGDIFIETGDGPDRIARLAAASRDAAFIHPPGEGYSYGNLPFALLGRVCETAFGAGFEEVVESRIAGPLALRLTCRPDRRAECASTLVRDHDGFWQEEPSDNLPTSAAACGSFAAARARDLVALARAARGQAATGGAAFAELLRPAIRAPGWRLLHIGLAWQIEAWGDAYVWGHSGKNNAASAVLRVAEPANAVLAAMVNGGDGTRFERLLIRAVFEVGLGLASPRPPVLLHERDPAGMPEGDFACASFRLTVRRQADALLAVITDAQGARILEAGLRPSSVPDVYLFEGGPHPGDGAVTVVERAPDGSASAALLFGRRLNRTAG